MSSFLPESIEYITSGWLQSDRAGVDNLPLSFLSCPTLEHEQAHPQLTRCDENRLLEVAPNHPVEYRSTHEPSEETKLESTRYGCPYRKRNPRMFNVRDHPICAMQSFATISLLKRHIRTAHLIVDFNMKCMYCESWFRDQKAFSSHLTTKMCAILPRPQAQSYDWGINKDMEDLLRDRRRKNQVLTWDGIWRTIFPGCTDVPDPYYEPIVEGPEAIESFFKGVSDLDDPMESSSRWTLRGQDLEQNLRTLYREVTERQERERDIYL